MTEREREREREREVEIEKELFISLYIHVFRFSRVLVSFTFSEYTERHSYRSLSPADHGGHGDIDYLLVKRSIVRGSAMSWLFI